MTLQASVYIATSVDGFIAREDGSVDWLPTGENQSGEDYGYQDFIDSVDTLVMGRNTYELVMSFGVPWPYGEKQVVILTNRPIDIPDDIAETVSAMSGSPDDIVQQLSDQGCQHIYIDGGKTIQAFLNAGLIQRLIITKIPILLGNGIPLFGPTPKDINLRVLDSQHFSTGFVQTTYQISDFQASNQSMI